MELSIALVTFVPQSTSYQAALGGFVWPGQGPLPASADLRGAEATGAIRIQRPPLKGSHLHWSDEARWVVLAIPADGALATARVLFQGAPRAAYGYLRDHGIPLPATFEVRTAGPWEDAAAGAGGVALGAAHAQLTVGDDGLAFAASVGGRATAGDGGLALSRFAPVQAGRAGHALTVHGVEATAGDHGVAIADEFGRATAGEMGLAIVGAGGTARVGAYGTALSRGSGHIEAGDHGQAFGGDHARSAAGAEGVAWTGEEGQASAGDRGIAVVGLGGSAQAGEGGLMIFLWFDQGRCRATVAHVGEAGILPHVRYHLGADGALIPLPRKP